MTRPIGFFGIGNGSFVRSFLRKHPELPVKRVHASELQPLNRVSDQTHLNQLRELGLPLQDGIDATKIHEAFPSERFRRLQWNCPNTGDSYATGNTRKAVEGFFASAAQCQNPGDSVHVTLPIPKKEGNDPFRQVCFYGLPTAALSAGYDLHAVHKMPSERYEGYTHRQTNKDRSAKSADAPLEFTFRRTETPTGAHLKDYRPQITPTQITSWKKFGIDLENADPIPYFPHDLADSDSSSLASSTESLGASQDSIEA